MENLLDNLKTLLQKDERLTSEGELLKNKIIELALKLDKELIKLFLSDKKMKEVFFVDIEGTLIFDKDKFIRFVSNKQFLPDSYTAFKNKIGLTLRDDYLSERKEVVLSWPYKDCVLEGGMTKEDQKRDEIFWNEILAPDEISRLLDPKVFTNAKRIDKNGEHPLLSLRGGDSRRSNPVFKTNEKDDIKDNLIIKGNNLLALHSLKKRFAGKVKLIYIDPPYNTGNDSFGYNDRFNHSSWLTFMKNRLEVASDLLRSDGVIFVQCDDNEQSHLKVLMDEIFNNNLVSNSIVVINRGGRDYGGIARTHEYILVYSKSPSKELNFIEEKNKKFDYQDETSGFNLMELRNRNVLFNDKNRPNLCYPIYVNSKKKDKNALYGISLEKKEGFAEVMPLKSQGIQTVWRWGKEKVLENLNKEIRAKEKQDGTFMIVQKYRKTVKRQRSVWDDKEFVNERGTEHIKELFGGKLFPYPKSEHLISRIIELGSDENDIVLDYHLGSGTTASAACKMGRRYIGIEQMDYIKTVTIERLKKVIAGEQGGISKLVGWQGGGDFVYLELMKWNENFVEKIRKAKTKEELKNLWATMNKKAFLSYKVDVKAIDEDAKGFEELSIEDQKRFLVECLDKNHLYVNYSEIDDEEYGVSEEDKRMNEEFYESK